jgi:hypothetical protein
MRRLFTGALIAGVVLMAFLFALPNRTTAAAQSCPRDYCVYLPHISKSPVDAPPLPENWLERFNAYRGAAGLPRVVEDPASSSDLAKHANYMLLNVPQEGLWHGETPGRPGYTPEGNQAATESNLYFSSDSHTKAATAIDAWMGSKGHRYGMLRPELSTTGFAIACDSQNCGSGLNVIRSLTGPNTAPDGVTYPGANQRGVNTTELISWQFAPYYGPEYAATNPLAVLTRAVLYDPQHRSVSITTSTPDSYWNIVTATPVAPLAPGTTYTMEMQVTLGSRQLSRTWSFTTRSG